MAAFVFNIAKGKVANYAELAAASDALIAVLLASSGLEADSVLKDLDTLAAVVAGTTNEATFTGYSRKTLTGVTVTVDDTADDVTVDFTDPQWSPTTAEALGKIVFCYDGDTAAGTDANIVPLWADDFVVTTPTSGTVTYQVNANGAFIAS